jgi:hypothetical protein
VARNNLTKDQLYNFVKVKGSQVVVDFDHDPAKNANSVILKHGTSADSNEKVIAGYLYYYNNGVWTQTKFDSAGNAGSGYLLGLGLGSPFGEATGSPTEVGMLIRGVTYASVFAGATIGAPLYGSVAKFGRMRGSAPGSGHEQILGWAIDSDASSGATLVLFDPQYYQLP